jgi:beta-glucanase (GH16 family)
MNASRCFLSAIVVSMVLGVVPDARADGPTKDVLDLKNNIEKRVSPQWGSEKQATATVSQDAAAPGLVIKIEPGSAGYPGMNLKPAEGEAWDLSAFGRIEATAVNTGDKVALFAVRLDNGDYQKSNTEQSWLKPGQKATVSVIFGYQYDHKPGYALNPKEITNILFFTDKAAAPKSLRVESLVAAGKAGDKPFVPPPPPAAIRIKPTNGYLVGGDVKLDPKSQIDAKGAQASVAGQAVEVVFPVAKGEQSLTLKPPVGRWDCRLATEIRVKLKNEGSSAVVPSVQVTSNGSPTDVATAPAPLAAGESREIVATFIPKVPGKGQPTPKAGYYGNQSGTGTNFQSDAVSGVKITAKHSGEAKLLVESVTVAAPPAVLPEWLGKRPPVEGDWTMTFNEEFDGPAIDAKKWNIYGPNYWDKASHWTKDNLILKDGKAIFRFEKKRGPHNDDPKSKPQNMTGKIESDYACGYLDTYGKWLQRYGYFEARVKLPQVPGLWPTFWMMPDRGPAAGPQWARGDTGKGAMELDIMEHLTRWGPYRYNIALHFDGYGKEHKSVGSPFNYTQADKDGFITSGLLWTPGATVFYCNGKEMWRWEGERVSNVQSHFIFEVTTGGWDNNAVDDKQLPADYVVDYVRAWQRKDLASSVDGYQADAKPAAK